MIYFYFQISRLYKKRFKNGRWREKLTTADHTLPDATTKPRLSATQTTAIYEPHHSHTLATPIQTVTPCKSHLFGHAPSVSHASHTCPATSSATPCKSHLPSDSITPQPGPPSHILPATSQPHAVTCQPHLPNHTHRVLPYQPHHFNHSLFYLFISPPKPHPANSTLFSHYLSATSQAHPTSHTSKAIPCHAPSKPHLSTHSSLSLSLTLYQPHLQSHTCSATLPQPHRATLITLVC